MKILVFDTIVTGHHIEYLNHLNIGATKMADIELVFVLPFEFEKIKKDYEWDCTRSKFIYYEILDKGRNGNNLWSVIKKSYYLSKLLKDKVDTLKPDAVYLNMMVYFMPALPFLLYFGPSIYGIIYKVYLYRWKKMKITERIQNCLIHFLYSKFKCIGGIFVLNDKSSTCYLNKLYNTNKYVFLPDPFNEQTYKGHNIRKEFQITNNEKVYLQFGSLTSRKGTCEILDALLLADEMELKNKVFVFAGVINDDIKREFNNKISGLEGRCKIIVFDKFCSNNEIADLCASSDYILCPYKETDLSSGVLGYAAFYKKPVIAPKSGLIGKLVKKWALGLTISQVTSESLYHAIIEINSFIYVPKPYIDTIKIEKFNQTIFGAIVK